MENTTSMDTVQLLSAKLCALSAEVQFVATLAFQPGVVTSKAMSCLPYTKVPKPPASVPPATLLGQAQQRIGSATQMLSNAKAAVLGQAQQRRGSVGTIEAAKSKSASKARMQPTSKAMPAPVKDEDVVIIYA